MKSENGFATIFALCFILVVALVVKGIQEVETNHTHEVTDFQIEFELQNAADGGIYKAAEIVRANREILPADRQTYQATGKHFVQLLSEPVSRKKSDSSYSIQVDVWGERVNIQTYRQSYPTGRKKEGKPKYGYVLLSVATFTDEAGNKKYRRSFAHVVDGYGLNLETDELEDKSAETTDKDVIHFMELPSVTK